MVRFLARSLICGFLGVALSAPAPARGGFNVLIGTEVSRAAQDTMSPRLWSRLVAQWVGEKAVPFSGKPTLGDCAQAKALYMLYAPFELRPELPGGTMQINDRIAALTHVTVVNCVTKATIFDQIIGLSSNPISTANPADTWKSTVAQTLRAHPIVFATLVHVVRVTPPFVTVAGSGGIGLGQTLRVYAGADGMLRDPPVILTVTAVFGKEVEARYDTSDPHNKVHVGDLVEPYAAVAPSH